MIAGTFLIGYGLARSFCEFFREPDAGHVLTIGPFTAGIFYSLPMIAGRRPDGRPATSAPGCRRCRGGDEAARRRLLAGCARASSARARCRSMPTCWPAPPDPEHGYWRKADTIGAGGRFHHRAGNQPGVRRADRPVVRPVWQGLGQSRTLLRLVELGPGRGTLMRDALRAARAVPSFLDAAASI